MAHVYRGPPSFLKATLPARPPCSPRFKAPLQSSLHQTGTNRFAASARPSLAVPRHLNKRSTKSAIASSIQEVEATDGEEVVKLEVEVAEDRCLYTVSLAKPLGVQLAEKGGDIVVEEVLPDGNAAKCGLIQPGDILRGVTGRIVEGGARRDIGGFRRSKSSLFGDLVFVGVDGEAFETVIAAIQSNRCSQCTITLALDRSI
ncbi:hypothetical protein CYMTET_23090 [Cymbomonas tetramitiformis]|uniref:PDZ domain-containing protein n=1 Tax=Cymbomonas tetramitiformis TaxID=36881 RepID=A0AAE0FYI6_9CHLO|nr:hypothetical protein CYMTET_23090 [Cymbomonas tetramitiformis]